MQKGRESARQNGFLPGWLKFTRPSLNVISYYGFLWDYARGAIRIIRENEIWHELHQL